MPVEKVIHLWAKIARKYSTVSLCVVKDFEAAARNISAEGANELATLYSNALLNDHVTSLNGWLETIWGTLPMGETERGIRNLMSLFRYLGDRGLEPFSTREIGAKSLIPSAPNVSRLPVRLAPLANAALVASKFTFVFSEEGRETIVKNVTPAERQILIGAADYIREVGYQSIVNWCRETGIQENSEASLMANLLGVVDALNAAKST